MTRELDRGRTEDVLHALLTVVKDHYLAGGGPDQQNVFEVLNALGCATATVIAGTHPDGIEDCRKFFADALDQQLNSTLEQLDRHGMAESQRDPATRDDRGNHGNNHRTDRRVRTRRT